MSSTPTYLGESLSLLVAIIWAFSVILFKKSGEKVDPIGLNLFKNSLAFVLFIPTIWLFDETLFRPAPASDYLLLLASGALGIGLADTFFFKSLNILGAGLYAIVDCLYSPFIIGLSILWLGETLTYWQIVGVMMIISAVLAVTGEKKHNHADKRTILIGIGWGVLAVAAMAVGIVMIKPLLDRSPLLWATEIRLAGGILFLLVVLWFHPSRRAIIQSVRSTHRWVYTLSGSFLGAYISMALWLGGMKYTQASTSAALNQTSNIFIFILAAIFLRERITVIRAFGITMGVAGALLVTFG
ncbi:MAG: hypothetical protein DRP45_08485 [Candidatus Zixiibacteriota bacterium]|nr:MAG: hypothetical protein DRP45_08485 [candidate division Zixibacteria bacterium]